MSIGIYSSGSSIICYERVDELPESSIGTLLLMEVLEDPVDQARQIAEYVAETVTWWDVTLDGRNLPVAQGVRHLPVLLLCGLALQVSKELTEGGER